MLKHALEQQCIFFPNKSHTIGKVYREETKKMSHRNWKIIFALIFLLILTVLLCSCTNEQTEDVGELVFGYIDENRFTMYI